MTKHAANDGRPTRSPLLVLWALAVATAPEATAQRAAVQEPASIAQAAVAFAKTQFQGGPTDSVLHVTATGLDPRLRMPACQSGLEGFAPAAMRPAARMTVGVRCHRPQWNVFVPVNIETEMTVLTLNRALTRLARPGAGDIEPRRMRVPGFAADYIGNPAELEGRHLRVAAAPGTALRTSLLERDTVIRRGQRVTLVAAAGGIEVRAQGEALADATAAGRVRVLNLNSRKIVEGRVETADRVRVDL